MSRSGYSDDGENWDLIRWRGAVLQATRGKRGQAFLREMVEALDAMPVKELDADVFVDRDIDGKVCACAMGVVAIRRLGVEHACAIYGEEAEFAAEALGIAHSLAKEIANENDEGGPRSQSPAGRWVRMRQWAASQLIEPQR